MLNHRAVRTVLILAAGSSLAGGCVPRQKYDEALALNTRCQAELARAKDAQHAAESQLAGLSETVQQRDAELAKRAREMELIDQANRELKASLLDMTRKYEDALKNNKPPVFSGPLPADINAALKELAASAPDLVEYDERLGMLKLKSDLTFDKGSATVGADAKTALDKLARIVNGMNAKDFNIYVAGHTDDIPVRNPNTVREFKDNWGLSLFRARSVLLVLTEAGVLPDRVGAMGFGMYHPVAPNAAGNKGNPANRRVEIWIVPPDRFLTSGSGTVTEAPKVSAPPAEPENLK